MENPMFSHDFDGDGPPLRGYEVVDADGSWLSAGDVLLFEEDNFRGSGGTNGVALHERGRNFGRSKKNYRVVRCVLSEEAREAERANSARWQTPEIVNSRIVVLRQLSRAK